jgi:hypothetical protein
MNHRNYKTYISSEKFRLHLTNFLLRLFHFSARPASPTAPRLFRSPAPDVASSLSKSHLECVPVRLSAWILPVALFATSISSIGQTLGTIKVTGPANLTVGAAPAAYTAAGTNIDGSSAGDITNIVKWTSTDTSVVTIDPATGFATPKKAGLATIWAIDPAGFASGPRSLTVVAAPVLPAVSSIAFAPANLTVASGQSITPTVTGTFGAAAAAVSQPIAAADVHWGAVAAPSVATIAANGAITGGTVTGTTPATTTAPVTVGPSASFTGTLTKTVTITVTPAPAAASIGPSFGVPPTDQSKTIVINGTAGDNISIFSVPAGTSLPAGTTLCNSAMATTPVLLVASAGSTTTAASVTLTKPPAPLSPSPFVLNLAQPLIVGTRVCAEDLGPASPAAGTPAAVGVWSPITPVVKAPTTLTIPTIDSKVLSGDKTINVTGASGDSISVFQYDPGLTTGSQSDCASWESQYRTVLQIVSSSGTAPIYTLPASTSTPITLSEPLLPGYSLCVTETATGFSPSSVSKPVVVQDANAFGRFRTYFLVGLQASNQLSSSSSSSSSTAGEYLEAGFNNYFVRAFNRYDSRAHADQINSEVCAAKIKAGGACPTNLTMPSTTNKFRGGLVTSIGVRLSPIPVAATTTTTGTNTNTNTSTATVTPNVLSSQQAVRFVGNIYAPFKTTTWNNNTDSFTVAPMGRGGFGTLVNPSTASISSTSGSSATTSLSSTNYSSAYYFWGLGTRIAWDRYPTKQDESPQTIVQLLATFGEYSNLPSYVCKAVPSSTTNPYSSTTTSTITSCNQGPYLPTSTTSTANPPVTTYGNLYVDSRALIPRLDLEAVAKIPGYPFVIGVNANLQQSTVYHKNNLDILNKPGNDIRIFIGVSINPATFFSKIGTPSF